MAEKEIWFRTSEGNDVCCNEGTVAYDLMSKNGAFRRIDGPGGEIEYPAAAAETDEIDLTKLTKKQLYDVAVERDVAVTDKMTKAEIIAAIEAAGEKTDDE